MSRWLAAVAMLVSGLFGLPAFAESCYVTTDSSATGPAGAQAQSCFEHKGMPAGSLNWSCSDRGEGLGVTKAKRASCPTGYFGKCTAALTQEALGNEASSGRLVTDDKMPSTVPESAQIITYHYQAADQGQARIDCEQGGGHWSP